MIEFVFAPGTGNETVISDDDIQQLNPIKTHTGKADLSASLAPNRSLEQFAQRQDRLNIRWNGETKWTGFVIDVSHNTASGDARLGGDGIAKRLEETRPDYESIGGSLTYTNESVADVLRDYWPRTPFSNVTVTDQQTELVAEGELIQDADSDTEWNNVYTIQDTDPLAVSGGELRLLQSCFTLDSPLDESNSATGAFDNNEFYSDGQASSLNSTNNFVEWTFTNEYTIPESAFEVDVRLDASATSPGHTWSLDGTDFLSVPEDGVTDTLLWRNITGESFGSSEWSGGDISPGTHTLRVDYDSGTGNLFIDVLAPNDGRYNYFFDNDNGGSDGYLDGPELFPDAAVVEFETVTTSFNLTAADVASVWDDVSNNQQIRASNDNGANWVGVSNSETLSDSFTTTGRQAVLEFTLSRYGSRTGETPLTGFNGQSVDSFEFRVDGDNLIVVDELELSRNHFDNLKEIHEYGDFLWTIEHSDSPIDELVVNSYPRGAIEKPAPDAFSNPINKEPEVQAGAYFNSIYLQGALREDGTRPTSEVKDDDAIASDGREISPGVLRDPKVVSEAGADFRARALLETALQNNDLVGSLTVPPVISHPGYSYPVDFGEGERYKTAEEVSLTQGTNTAEARFEFVVRPTFAEDISSLRRNANNIGDKV